MPQEWENYGARFGRDGLLYLAEWRRGYTVHELRALFFECQQLRSLRIELRQTQTDLEQITEERDHWQRRAHFYRSQCVAETKLGLALARIIE